MLHFCDKCYYILGEVTLRATSRDVVWEPEAQRNVKEFLFPSDMQCSYDLEVSFVEIKVPMQATSPRCRLTANALSAKGHEPDKPIFRTQWQSISAMNCMLATSANHSYCKRHRAMSCDCRDIPFCSKPEVCENNMSATIATILGKVTLRAASRAVVWQPEACPKAPQKDLSGSKWYAT